MMTKALTMMCVLLGALSTARADIPPLDDGVQDQLVLPKGRVVIDAFLTLGLDDGAKPFSISPDIWYGVTDDLTLGLVHSSDGQTGFIGMPGTSLCISGDDNCAHVYQNVGLEARYRISHHIIAWAIDGGLYFRDFDPTELGIKIGAVGRWRTNDGKFTLEGEPAFYFGITNRSTDIGLGESITTNGDSLLMPLTGMYSLNNKISLALQVGFVIPFQDTSDTWSFPLSLGVHYLATEKLNLTAAFTLTRLFGGSSADAFDGRSITIGGSYAL